MQSTGTHSSSHPHHEEESLKRQREEQERATQEREELTARKEPEGTSWKGFFTVALVLGVLLLGYWALAPGATEENKKSTPIPIPTLTLTPIPTPSPTPTPSPAGIPEVTPTGNKVMIKLEINRGFIPTKQAIKAGDEIVWRNDGTVAVTLVSSDGLFNDKILAYDKEFRYTFKKTGTYTFNLKGKEMKGTIIVEP